MTAPRIIRQATIGVAARTLGGRRTAVLVPEADISADEVSAGVPASMAGTAPFFPSSTPPRMTLTEADVERRAHEMAQRLLEQEGQAALQAARKKGYSEGLAAAEKLARQETDLLRQRTGQLLAALERVLESEVAASENLAIQIAFAAVAKLLGQSARDAGTIGNLVRQAASAVRAEGKIKLRLGSADTELLKSHHIDLTAYVPAGLTFELQEDSTIDAGGCILESDHGTLDARLDIQLQALCRLLRDVHRVQAGPEAEGVPS